MNLDERFRTLSRAAEDGDLDAARTLREELERSGLPRFGPRGREDCTSCFFLGYAGMFDLWVCPEEAEVTVRVRPGDNGHQTSPTEFAARFIEDLPDDWRERRDGSLGVSPYIWLAMEDALREARNRGLLDDQSRPVRGR